MGDESDPTADAALARVAHFLGRYGQSAGGRTGPPAEFGDVTWDAVCRRAFARLGGGTDYRRFKSVLLEARRRPATGRRRGGGWADLPRAAQWAEVRRLLQAAAPDEGSQPEATDSE